MTFFLNLIVSVISVVIAKRIRSDGRHPSEPSKAFGTLPHEVLASEAAFREALNTPCIDKSDLPTQLTWQKGRAHICNDRENPVAKRLEQKGRLGAYVNDVGQIGHTYLEMRLETVGGIKHRALPHCYDMKYLICLHRSPTMVDLQKGQRCMNATDNNLNHFECRRLRCMEEDGGVHFHDFINAGCGPLVETAIKYRDIRQCMSSAWNQTLTAIIKQLKYSVVHELRNCKLQGSRDLCVRLDDYARQQDGEAWQQIMDGRVNWFHETSEKPSSASKLREAFGIRRAKEAQIWNQSLLTDEELNDWLESDDRLEEGNSFLLGPLEAWAHESDVFIETKILQGASGFIKYATTKHGQANLADWKLTVVEALLKMKHDAFGDGHIPISTALRQATTRFVKRCAKKLGSNVYTGYVFRSGIFPPMKSTMMPGTFTGRTHWMIWQACDIEFSELLAVVGLSWLAYPGASSKVSDCVDFGALHALRCTPVMWSSVGFQPPLTAHPNFDGDTKHSHGDSGDCQSSGRGKRLSRSGEERHAVVKEDRLIDFDKLGHLLHMRYVVEQVLPKFQGRKLNFADYFKPISFEGGGGYFRGTETVCDDDSITGICWVFTMCLARAYHKLIRSLPELQLAQVDYHISEVASQLA